MLTNRKVASWPVLLRSIAQVCRAVMSPISFLALDCLPDRDWAIPSRSFGDFPNSGFAVKLLNEF